MPNLTKDELTKSLEKLRKREKGLAAVLAEVPEDADDVDVQNWNDGLRLVRSKITDTESQLSEIDTAEQIEAEREQAEKASAALEAYEALEARGATQTATPELRAAALAERERRGLQQLLGY